VQATRQPVLSLARVTGEHAVSGGSLKILWLLAFTLLTAQRGSLDRIYQGANSAQPQHEPTPSAQSARHPAKAKSNQALACACMPFVRQRLLRRMLP
jgi:hypothetical protein